MWWLYSCFSESDILKHVSETVDNQSTCFTTKILPYGQELITNESQDGYPMPNHPKWTPSHNDDNLWHAWKTESNCSQLKTAQRKYWRLYSIYTVCRRMNSSFHMSSKMLSLKCPERIVWKCEKQKWVIYFLIQYMCLDRTESSGSHCAPYYSSGNSLVVVHWECNVLYFWSRFKWHTAYKGFTNPP